MAITEDIIVRTLLRHRMSLLAYIEAIVRDDNLAEDVLQDVGALAVTKRDQIESESHLAGWLRRACRFRAWYAVRQRSRQPATIDETLLDRMESAWERAAAIGDSDRVEAVRHCVGLLSEEARRLIDLRYGQSIKGEALAIAVGKKPNTVFVALSRIHQKLGDCIRGQLGEQRA